MAVRVLERRRFVRISCAGSLPAPLIHVATGTTLVCKSIDVSRMGLSILSSEELKAQDELTMDISGETIKLRVVAIKQDAPTALWRYGLLAQNVQENLEARFRTAGLIVSQEKPVKRGSPQEPKPVARRSSDDRAPRFGIDWVLRLDANVLGNRSTIQLFVANISRSGMLVTTSETELRIIGVNTLLDITLDPEKKHLSRPIHGFAKVVRLFSEESPDTAKKRVSLGIVISEIFPEDLTAWDMFMKTLERAAESATQGGSAA